MVRTDAGPVESPQGIAIANSALLTSLMNTLIMKGALNKFEAYSVIIAAQREIAPLPDSPIYNDAKFVLRGLVKRFPAQ